MASVGAAAATWSIARDVLGTALSATAGPSDAPSTMLQRIVMGPVQQGSYRTLVNRDGEPHIPRIDLIGTAPDAARTSTRRSLLYFGHLSDIHVIDAQSPARLEPLIAQSHSLWAGAFRPQDTLTTHVAASMVQSLADLRTSPVTGAPMAAAFVTGDSADMLSSLETRWYIDILDGTPITPNSGEPLVYDGVQAWSEAPYAYHPDDPSTDPFGVYGFPRVPGMLTAAVTHPVESVGLPVPWYTVYGNHDTTYLGVLAITPALRTFATGGRKAFDWTALGLDYVLGWSASTSALGNLVQAMATSLGLNAGMRAVAPDPARKLLEQRDFMTAHLQTAPNPGPVGHGFTQDNLDTGRTYWSADIGPFVRAIGLDTCNQIAGPDGAVPQEQFDWMVAEIERAQADGRLVLVFSHHNSFTLENGAALPTAPQRFVHAEELVDTLLRHPNVVAWVNGHTHNNTITAHARTDGRPGGFWEITTASCIDFPQQNQVVEIVDNRDGTLSLFTTAVDHAASAQWTAGDFSQLGLASLSRELSANDWVENPAMRMGSPLDRNTELLLPAPFDLSRITDAQVEQAQLQGRARLLAYEAGWSA